MGVAVAGTRYLLYLRLRFFFRASLTSSQDKNEQESSLARSGQFSVIQSRATPLLLITVLVRKKFQVLKSGLSV
jgi:hypothetical protein